MRKVEIAHLSPGHRADTPPGPASGIADLSGAAYGDVAEFSCIVPAIDAFDEAFTAFARGTLMPTTRGVVAIEDLWPGDAVRTANAGFQTLMWRGTTVITDRAGAQEAGMGTLTRISADALGIARPLPDLILGPRAQLSHRSAGIQKLTGSEAAFIPARDFLDGVNIVELTPPTAVQVYHLGFMRQHKLIANGVEVGSMHPGPAHRFALRGEMLTLYLSCFPHMRSIEDFGAPAQPRLRLADLGLFDAA